jgi:hypothetical protein
MNHVNNSFLLSLRYSNHINPWKLGRVPIDWVKKVSRTVRRLRVISIRSPRVKQPISSPSFLDSPSFQVAIVTWPREVGKTVTFCVAYCLHRRNRADIMSDDCLCPSKAITLKNFLVVNLQGIFGSERKTRAVIFFIHTTFIPSNAKQVYSKSSCALAVMLHVSALSHTIHWHVNTKIL